MLIKIAETFVDIQCALNFFSSEMNALISELKIRYTNHNDNVFDKICVAVSGGSDSMALLLMVISWAREYSLKVVCVTVDHKLRKESAEEAIFVKEFCKLLGIEHHILFWNHTYNRKNHILKIGKLEQLAREVRYALLRDFCIKESIRIVVTGHNWNDQVETFEIRKEYGSSWFGLACMSRIRSLYANVNKVITVDDYKYQRNLFLLRPLLHFTKQYLRAFLKATRVEWKNDPMNEQDMFRRVFFRKKINCLNKDVLDNYYYDIKKFGLIRRNVEEEAVSFLKNETYCRLSDLGYILISFADFVEKRTNVQCEIIRRCVWNIGGKQYATGISDEVLLKILSGQLNTIGRCFIKITKKWIQIFRENRSLCKKKELLNTTSCIFNNFLVTIDKDDRKGSNSFNKYTVYSLDTFGISASYAPYEASYSLPCVLCNRNIIFAHGIGYMCTVNDRVACNFLHRVDLFDVFL